MGMLYKRGNIWWVKYYRDGRPLYESARTASEKAAKDLLRVREGDIAKGVPVTPKMNRCKVDELLEDVVKDYQVRKLRSLDGVERRIRKHLKLYFGGWRASAVTADRVREYIVRRQEAKASNAEINRELAVLKRGYTLGMDGHKVLLRPKIPKLEEDNVRTGFFEREQFEAVRGHLPSALRPVVAFAYITGWRVNSEVLRLRWRNVDFSGGTVRLDAGTTKNKEGRVFPFTAELRSVLEAQRANTRAVERDRDIVCPFVFHRDGSQIRYFRRSWITACTKAGCPGSIPHDFRRTAVRNLVRAGVPERVAMQMTGHKTRSVFERYNIVSEADLREAARRIDTVAG